VSVIAIVARSARLLAAHWPALLAWMLGGTLAHYLVLELASLVGARTALGGILLLPVAALCLLVAYVAMFLVLRDGMPKLRSLAPLPEDARGRRKAFLDGILGGILPFVAFYTAWGFMREDVVSYINGAFAWQFLWGLSAAVSGADYDTSGTIDDLGFDTFTLSLLLGAFVARWLHQRYRARLPAWTGVAAVYLEALWVYLAAYLVKDALGLLTAWVDGRQAMVWLADLREGLVGVLAPVGFLWDGVEWLLGEAGGLILLPVAWLTIAGVIYGQAVRAEAPQLSGRAVDRWRSRYGTIPQRLRRRLADLGESFIGRFRPIGRALVLMWRAGPVLIGSYVLLSTLVTLAEQWGLVGISRLLGPHDYRSFWGPVFVALTLAMSVLVEPLRVSVVAASYDETLDRLSAVDREPQVEPADGIARGGELDDEVVADASGEQDKGDEVVRNAGA